MPPVSAGLLMYKVEGNDISFFLGHPGGPYFKKKDEGNWTIPKGLVENDDDLLKTAIREFEEETGIMPEGEYLPLGSVKYKNGKTLYGWCFESLIDKIETIKSNTFTIEWPPRTGQMQTFPEIDQAAFFDPDTAKRKIHPVQIPFIENALKVLV